MSKVTPITEKIIELYALYEIAPTIYKKLREEYGDNCPTLDTIKKIREKFRPQILAKREQQQAQIPLLDPSERWAYLQKIIDGALEGEIVYDKRTGEPIKAVIDRGVALNALKLAHDMTNVKGTVNTEDEEAIKLIVAEAYAELKEERPEMTDEEILTILENDLGEKVLPYIEAMRKEVYAISH